MTALNISSSPLRDAMFEAASRAEKNGPRRSYIGMSGIGGKCERAQWYAFRGYTPSALEGRVEMIFDLGRRVEDAVIEWIRLAGYHVEGQQAEYTACGGWFKGHCDGIIHGVSSNPHILEVKSASASRFKAFQLSGVRAVSESYFQQVQCYMHYAGLKRAVFVIMSKDNCDIYTERVHYARSEAEAMERKAWKIIRADSPDALDAKEEDCRLCGFRQHCKARPGEPYVQTDKSCGSCIWCHAAEDGFLCGSPKHRVALKHIERKCPEWSFREDVDRVPF